MWFSATRKGIVTPREYVFQGKDCRMLRAFLVGKKKHRKIHPAEKLTDGCIFRGVHDRETIIVEFDGKVMRKKASQYGIQIWDLES